MNPMQWYEVPSPEGGRLFCAKAGTAKAMVHVRADEFMVRWAAQNSKQVRRGIERDLEKGKKSALAALAQLAIADHIMEKYGP